jgi:hypothetical protein
MAGEGMGSSGWSRVRVDLSERGSLAVETESLALRYSRKRFADGAVNHVITRFVHRPSGVDLVGDQLDGVWYGFADGAQALTRARVVEDGPERTGVHAEWDEGRITRRVTAFRRHPLVRVDYLAYGVNVVDLSAAREPLLHGQEQWRATRADAAARWPELLDLENPHERLTTSLHPAYPSPLTAAAHWRGLAPDALDCEGYVVLTWHDAARSVGFGRLVPMEAASHMKLLEGGVEVFPFWREDRRPPFHCYLFAAAGTTEEVLESGRAAARAAAGLDVAVSYGNEHLRVTHGVARRVEGNLLSGITGLVHVPTGDDFAIVLDACGTGYARYFRDGPPSVEVGRDGSGATVTTRDENCHMVKHERLWDDAPVLEVEYRRLDLTWWEDFYRVPCAAEDSPVYRIHGLAGEVDRARHAELRATAEAAAGHNFGTAFLAAAGVSPEQCTYRGHLVFALAERRTGRGLGFVIPARVGLKDGFKLWSMGNYESFPFWDAEDRRAGLPLKRWIYVADGTERDPLSLGRRIADRLSSR